jgi:hypothetical protein
MFVGNNYIKYSELSFYAGSVEPELLITGLSFSYDYYNEFNEEMRLLWQMQALLAWTFEAKQLTKFAELHPEAKQPVEKAFVNSPGDWKKFSHDLEIHLQKNLLLPAK